MGTTLSSPRTSPKQKSRSPNAPRLSSDTLDRLIEEGGDWDRRNRLKVYRGLHAVSIRQFATAGELLLDAISTFTATELISYNDFVALTIIINSLTLKRVDLQKKVRRYFGCVRMTPDALLSSLSHPPKSSLYSPTSPFSVTS